MVDDIDLEIERREQEELQQLQEEKNLTCFCCKEKILEDSDYYKCQYHGTIFCKDCTFRPREGQVDEDLWVKPAKCIQKHPRIDCIWQKRHKPYETMEAELKANNVLFSVSS